MFNQCRYLIILALVNTAFAAIHGAQEFDQDPAQTFWRAVKTGNDNIVRSVLQVDPCLYRLTDSHGNTALHYAVVSGSLPVVECLFSVGKPELEKKNKNGQTPLWIAAYGNAFDIARFLVEQGAEVHVLNSQHHAPIHHAAAHGAVDLVRLFIQHGAVVNCTDLDGNTPLHSAASEGYDAAVRYLISCGAEVNARNNKNETPLHKAVLGYHFNAIRVLVQSGADLHAKAHVLGNTPLVLACLKTCISYHPEVLRYLVVHGSPVDSICKSGALKASKLDAQTERKAYEATQIKAMENASLPLPTDIDNLILDFVRGSNPGVTATPEFEIEMPHQGEHQLTGIFPTDMPFAERLSQFWQSARQGSLNVVRAAIKQHPGLYTYVRSARQNVALHYAVIGGSLPMVEFLVSCSNEEINKKNSAGVTPFWIAADRNYNKIVCLLVSRGADVNTKDKNKRTPLHCAALHGADDLVHLFVRNGAVVTCRDVEGCTPLHIAINNGHLNVVSQLLKLGAEINVRDLIGQTPLHVAAFAGSLPLVQLLVQQGADMSAKDDQEVTPLLAPICANKGDWKEIVRYLVANGSPVDRHSRQVLSLSQGNWPEKRRRYEAGQIQALNTVIRKMPTNIARCILDYVRAEGDDLPGHLRSSAVVDQRPTKRQKRTE